MSMVDAVEADLRQYPPRVRAGGLAAVALWCAGVLDEGTMQARDAASLVREIRLALIALHDTAAGDFVADKTDEVRRRRELRMAEPAPDKP